MWISRLGRSGARHRCTCLNRRAAIAKSALRHCSAADRVPPDQRSSSPIVALEGVDAARRANRSMRATLEWLVTGEVATHSIPEFELRLTSLQFSPSSPTNWHSRSKQPRPERAPSPPESSPSPTSSSAWPAPPSPSPLSACSSPILAPIPATAPPAAGLSCCSSSTSPLASSAALACCSTPAGRACFFRFRLSPTSS
ncbi:MAG: hypothetical protein JWP26_817 [Devosia sp.]|nr:hypothetical protein [Devosia sp.]